MYLDSHITEGINTKYKNNLPIVRETNFTGFYSVLCWGLCGAACAAQPPTGSKPSSWHTQDPVGQLLSPVWPLPLLLRVGPSAAAAVSTQAKVGSWGSLIYLSSVWPSNPSICQPVIIASARRHELIHFPHFPWCVCHTMPIRTWAEWESQGHLWQDTHTVPW